MAGHKNDVKIWKSDEKNQKKIRVFKNYDKKVKYFCFLFIRDGGRKKVIPMEYIERISKLYALDSKETDMLSDSINETNKIYLLILLK